MWSRRSFLRTSSLAVIGSIFVPKYERWFKPIIVAKPEEVQWYAALFSADGQQITKAPIFGLMQPGLFNQEFDATFPVHVGPSALVSGVKVIDKRGRNVFEERFAMVHGPKYVGPNDQVKFHGNIRVSDA